MEKTKNDCEKSTKDSEEDQYYETTMVPECAVCLQICIHPAQLPCSHVFCFLCIKGVANQSKKCPLCRHEIPADFLEKPSLLNFDDKTKVLEEYQWFYEGRNGWWQYDQRTSLELETAYKEGKRSCELLIAGFLYIADFESMLQMRRNDPSRRRRIKRDLYNIPKKGVAGLRLLTEQEEQCFTRGIRGAERSMSSQNLDTAANEPNVSTWTSASIAETSGNRTDNGNPGENEVTNRIHSLHYILEQMRSLVVSDNVEYSSDEMNVPVISRTVSGHSSPSRVQSDSRYDQVQL